MPEPDCLSCGEELPRDECPSSLRECGHHCDCSWTQDVCCWCLAEFGDQDEPGFGVPKARSVGARLSKIKETKKT